MTVWISVVHHAKEDEPKEFIQVDWTRNNNIILVVDSKHSYQRHNMTSWRSNVSEIQSEDKAMAGTTNTYFQSIILFIGQVDNIIFSYAAMLLNCLSEAPCKSDPNEYYYDVLTIRYFILYCHHNIIVTMRFDARRYYFWLCFIAHNLRYISLPLDVRTVRASGRVVSGVYWQNELYSLRVVSVDNVRENWRRSGSGL